MKSLLTAVAFLTRFPAGRVVEAGPRDVANSAAWFPFIGLLLGAMYGLAAAVLRDHLPLETVAVLLVILDGLATGALHYDGLADTADGFGGGRNPEDALRIMRDHAIGSYGGLALVAIVALKAAAYKTLLSRPGWITALILTPALGRWSILLLTATLPYARQSASVIHGMGKRSLLWGTICMLAALAATQSARGWIATVAVLAVTAAFGFYCRRRIAGITGDTLGANLQLCEAAALLAFLWTGHAQ